MEFLNLLLPIFAIILTGFVVSHFKLLPEAVGDILIQFAYNIGLPALLFLVIAQESLVRLFDPGFLVSYGGGTFFFFVLILLLARVWRKASTGDAVILALIGACANTAFVALPILKSTFGHKAVLPAAMACVIMVAMILVGVLLIERSRRGDDAGQGSVWSHVRHALLNPLVLAVLLGVVYAAVGLPVPVMAAEYLTLLGDSVTPCALFAVGMSIRLQSLKTGAAAILLLSTIKLIVIPAAVLFLVLLFDLDPFLSVAAVICAAVPTAKTIFVLASQYDHLKELAAETVSVGTLASTATLFVWLIILAQFYPATFGAS